MRRSDQEVRVFISDDHERRMAAARARSEYEIGDPSWAAVIVGAYLNPEADAAELAKEKSQ